MSIKQNQYFLKMPIVFKLILTILLGVAFFVLTYRVHLSCAQSNLMFIYREGLVCAFFAFLLLNVYIDYKKLYDFIFKYRYPIALTVFICLVAAKINLSSISLFDSYVQPGTGSEFVEPVFGQGRPIRSDEWAVSTPKSLTYQYCVGEKYNDIIMASQTLNIKTTGVAVSLSMVTKPFNVGFLFLPPEYAVSFYWCSLFITGILAGIEFFLIITKENRLLSFMGSVMVILSPFSMWWSGNSLATYAMAAVAGIYRFLNAEGTKKRILCAIVITIFGSAFVGVLYPAWQVPAGYTFLGVIIWCFVLNWANIKKFKVIDWILFSSTVVLALTVIAVFYLENLEYTKTVLNTVYPGSRREYGGFMLDRMFFYPANLSFPFETRNLAFSEVGMYFSLYPVPTLVAIYLLFKTKKKDLLTILLLVVSTIFTVYCTVGVPIWFGDISLLSYSTPVRALTYVDFIQILLLLRSMTLLKENDSYIPKFVIIPLALILSAFIIYKCDKVFIYPDYMSLKYMLIVAIMIFVLIVCFVGRVNHKLRTCAILLFIMVHCVTSVFVLPIQKGLDPIYSKPVAKAVSSIVEDDPDAKWIAVDQWVEANFYAACGAKVINSNNYVPNYSMWEILDPNGKYNEVYNRYANFVITMTEEENEAILNQPDLITLKLNYGQLDDIDVKYLIAKHEIAIPDDYDIDSKQLYAEHGMYIYELSYN